jgi:hypothetical protein
MLIAAPALSSKPPCPLPAGARIRHDTHRVRRLRYRRFRRARLHVTVLTVVGPHAATVTGITLYGACLQGGRRLRRREIVALRLPSGHRITGRVRWRLGTRSGVVFATPVADFARLISEGALVHSLRRRRLGPSDRPPMLFLPNGPDGQPAVAVSRLRDAVAKAWSLIEQIASRAAKGKTVMRRFD